MLFDILGAVAQSAVEKVKETKENYDNYYEQYSEKAVGWDDQRLIKEYERTSDFARRAALLRLLKERGLVKE